MILYGTNSFKLKAYQPHEVEFPNDVQPYTIEKHQKYFHLYYIPFFPTSQYWAIRRSDNQLYQVAPEGIRHLDSLGHAHKTPWYAFIGLFLIGFGLLLAAI